MKDLRQKGRRRFDLSVIRIPMILSPATSLLSIRNRAVSLANIS